MLRKITIYIFSPYLFCIIRLQELENNDALLPGTEMEFDVQVLSDPKLLYRALQRVLQKYRDEKRGPTMIILQTAVGTYFLFS